MIENPIKAGFNCEYGVYTYSLDGFNSLLRDGSKLDYEGYLNLIEDYINDLGYFGFIFETTSERLITKLYDHPLKTVQEIKSYLKEIDISCTFCKVNMKQIKLGIYRCNTCKDTIQIGY